MKAKGDIWSHIPPQDCCWYWKKLNSLKGQMQEWYQNGTYSLTAKGNYSVTSSYLAMLGTIIRMKEADLVWSSVMQPRQQMIVWLANQDATY